MNVNQVIPLIDRHGNDPTRARIGEGCQFRFFDDSFFGDHDNGFTLRKIPNGQNRGHALSRRDIDQVDDGFALGGPAALRDLIDLQPIDFPPIGKDQNIMMSRGDKDLFDKILFLGAHADLAFAAAVLAFIEADGVALDISGMGNRDHHVFFDNHVFNIDVFRTDDDFRTPLIPEAGPDLLKFGHNHIEDLPGIIQNSLQGSDQTCHFRIFRVNFFPFQAGQALQPHIQNSLCLNLGETKFFTKGSGSILGIFSFFDYSNDRINLTERNDEPRKNMRPFPGAGQIKLGPADDDLLPEIDKTLEDFLEIKNAGLSLFNRQHDDPKGVLHLGMFIELIENDARDFIPLKINDDADPLPVGFITQIRDAADLFFFHQFGNMLDQLRLVHLIGQFRHDDTFLFIPGITFNQSPGPDPDNPPARPVSRVDTLLAVDKTGGRKVGTLNMAHQFIYGDLGIFNHRNGPADDLTKIVRGNIRRHADGNA